MLSQNHLRRLVGAVLATVALATYSDAASGAVVITYGKNQHLGVWGGNAFDHVRIRRRPDGRIEVNDFTTPGVERVFNSVRSLHVSTGGSGDIVIVDGLDLSGTMVIESGNGGDTLTILDCDAQSISIDAGRHSDIVTFSNTTAFLEATIVGGAGHDTISCSNLPSAIGALPSLIVEGGVGNDNIHLLSAFAFAIVVDGGDGNNNVVLDDAAALDIVVGVGVDQDHLQFTDVNTDTLTVTDGGGGCNTTLEGNSDVSDFTASTGAGADAMTIMPGVDLETVSITTGSGNDVVNFDDIDHDIGSVTINTGHHKDQVSISTANNQTLGSVTINLGQNGSLTPGVEQVAVTGAVVTTLLGVTSQAGNCRIDIEDVLADEIQVTTSQFAKLSSNDAVTMTDTNVWTLFTINTGRGHDDVAFFNSSITELVIDLGSGNDHLEFDFSQLAGLDSYINRLNADGGDGTDDIQCGSGVDFGPQFVLNGFEIVNCP